MSYFFKNLLDDIILSNKEDINLSFPKIFANSMSILSKKLGANKNSIYWVSNISFYISKEFLNGNIYISLKDFSKNYKENLDDIRKFLFESYILCNESSIKKMALPLIIDNDDMIYLSRYYIYEESLASSIISHISRWNKFNICERFFKLDEFNKLLDIFFGKIKVKEVDWQRIAVISAIENGLTIISGGPGTGKTSTITIILICLLHISSNLRIAIAAPTGQAAKRIQESLFMHSLKLNNKYIKYLPKESYTLHRLLGKSSNKSCRFNKKYQLQYDVIIIDESSMIDLAMIKWLFDAILPNTRIIMIGDKNQLKSVEAGNIFSVLSMNSIFSKERIQYISKILNINEKNIKSQLLKSNINKFSSLLSNCVIHLSYNYRFSSNSSIGRLAIAVQKGSVDNVLNILDQKCLLDESIKFYEKTEESFLITENNIVNHLLFGFEKYIKTLIKVISKEILNLEKLFDSLNNFRILCAIRSGESGVDNLNTLISKNICKLAKIKFSNNSIWHIGRVIRISKNNYNLGLFNGDIGIALPNDDNEIEVYFRLGNNNFRSIPIILIPFHESAFALTVHQSQGCEFNYVAFILPKYFDNFLSRELIYTAITRAKKKVEIIGSKSIFFNGICTFIKRNSSFVKQVNKLLS